jgi:hypothetical protein
LYRKIERSGIPARKIQSTMWKEMLLNCGKLLKTTHIFGVVAAFTFENNIDRMRKKKEVFL